MGDSRRSAAVAVALLFTAVSVSAAITISSITPASGLTQGGEIVHIHGTNLFPAPVLCPAITCSTYVKFGDVFGTVLVGTATEIVVVAPAHAAGAVDLQINVPVNPPVTLTSAYTYFDAPAEEARVLVPIVINAAGANGSNWQTDLVAYNGNAEPVTIGDTTIAPLSTAALALRAEGGSAGAFVAIPKRLADKVSVSARVHDTSRDSDSWGVEVPAVSETQFRRSVALLAVPGDARYRVLLRVYGYNTFDDNVTVTLRDDATGELLDTRTLALRFGYGQLYIDALRPRMRAEVSTPFSLLWAFASITNNVTQQVTTITPMVTTSAVSPPSRLAPGSWGNGGKQCVTVRSNGVSVEAGCWHGAFPLPLIGADGHFEAEGTLYFGGPSPAVPPPGHFSGTVQGNTMILTGVSGSNTVGPITVTFGDTTPCVLCL